MKEAKGKKLIHEYDCCCRYQHGCIKNHGIELFSAYIPFEILPEFFETDMLLVCKKRITQKIVYQEGMVINESILKNIDNLKPRDFELFINQFFTYDEIIQIIGFVAFHFNQPVVVNPVLFPIVYQKPYEEYFENSFLVLPFNNLKCANLPFEFLGIFNWVNDEEFYNSKNWPQGEGGYSLN